MPSIEIKLNGAATRLNVDPQQLLVETLRRELGLTGTHVGCDTSQCGACTVLLDGQAVKSCSLLTVQADGHEVTTIEGIGSPQAMHPVQQAFVECHGLQCGFCTPGMIMATLDLLRHNPKPDDAAIEHALQGNLCRCTGYVNIVAAVRRAADTLNAR
jgi:aerobic carbon-monoxide dehydrogenase small subunit